MSDKKGVDLVRSTPFFNIYLFTIQRFWAFTTAFCIVAVSEFSPGNTSELISVNSRMIIQAFISDFM
jgi:hypothetical protein